MLRTIHLSGDLAEFCDSKTFIFDVDSVGEAIRALEANFKGFIDKIKKDGLYRVVLGNDLDNPDKHLNEDTVFMNYNNDEDIWMHPVVGGSKQGMWQTIIGAVLIVVGVLVMAYVPGVGVPIGKFLIGTGVSMMLGGIAQMLFPMPTIDDYSSREDANNRQSAIFDGPVNTVGQGGPVPVAYGRVLLGSTVISAGIDVEDA